MRDVVIVGGGLTGLAAAYELERLKIPYTIIEVKNRLGGSIISEDRAGFVIDGGPMMVPAAGDWSFLDELGLAGALVAAGPEQVMFEAGTQALVDAFAGRLHGSIMKRMAVSSLGRAENRFGVCLENGLALDARALIVTAPARYAGHMLYSLEPAASERLNDYLYDTIIRLSVGYRCDDLPQPPALPPDMAFVYCHWTDSPSRVPSGHVLAQVGVRLKLNDDKPADWVQHILEDLRWPLEPVVTAVHAWAEADPLTCHAPGHAENITALRRLLPPGVALAGSDYDSLAIPDRVNQGRAAAHQAVAWLGVR